MDHTLRPALMAVASTQQGLFTRPQALDAGYSADEVRARTHRRGPWQVVRRGVYLLAERWANASDTEQWWWRDVAAHLLMTQRHLLSHDSAARGLGVPLLVPARPLSHVTRRGVGGSRTRHGVKHHLGRELPAATATRDGIVTTGVARTALDLAREHGFAAGVVAIDAVRHQGAGLREFELELARMTSWPYVGTCRSALAFSDSGAESVGESLTRILLAEMGWGPIFTQFPVPARDGARWCDLRVGRHVVEFDGRIKYVDRAAGGFAEGDPADVAWRDRQRDVEVTTHGLGISHLTWHDLFGGREPAKARLAREVAATRLRFGTELPDHLRRFAEANPRTWRRTA
jgi:hypothetical protein